MIELGYIEKHDEDSALAVKKCVNENLFYLARTYLTKRDYKEAEKILGNLFSENSNIQRYGLYYLQALQHLNKIEEAKEVIKMITERSGKNPRINILHASVSLLNKDYKGALNFLKEAAEAEVNQPRLYIDIALLYLQLNKLDEAEESFEKAIELDEDNPAIYMGIAELNFRKGLYEEAADNALAAIGLLYYFPSAHLLLGKSLLKLGKIDEAEMAFQLCLKMVPDNYEANLNICYIYEIFKKDNDKALHHRKILVNLRRDKSNK